MRSCPTAHLAYGPIGKRDDRRRRERRREWFVKEEGSPAAEALLTDDTSRAAPEHIVAEVGQALLRHHRSKKLTLDQCREALVRLRRVLRFFPTEVFAGDAIGLASEAECSMYDALYLAAANRWDCILFTADAKLAEKVVGTHWMRRIRLLGQA